MLYAFVIGRKRTTTKTAREDQTLKVQKYHKRNTTVHEQSRNCQLLNSGPISFNNRSAHWIHQTPAQDLCRMALWHSLPQRGRTWEENSTPLHSSDSLISKASCWCLFYCESPIMTSIILLVCPVLTGTELAPTTFTHAILFLKTQGSSQFSFVFRLVDLSSFILTLRDLGPVICERFAESSIGGMTGAPLPGISIPSVVLDASRDRLLTSANSRHPCNVVFYPTGSKRFAPV